MASGNTSGGRGNGDEPRMPKDMKGLLRLCAEASDPNRQEESPHFQAMDPEVMSEIFGKRLWTVIYCHN